MKRPAGLVRSVKLTPVQQNVLHYVKMCIDRAVRKLVAKNARRSLARTLWDGVAQEREIASITQLFSALASWGTPPRSPDNMGGDIARLVRSCICRAFTGFQHGVDLERLVMRELHKHAEEYDLLSQVPRERRTRRTQPQTLIESRAGRVDDQIRAWERKIRYAKTRLAKLRRKQKYYQKKGAVA